MPEGNEIHRWAERHSRAFVGRKMHVEGPNSRFREADALDGRTLERVMAKGKHLGYSFGKDRILHVHLGRYGDWTEGQMPLGEVKGALRLRMWPVGAKPRRDAAEPSARHGWYSADDGANPTPPEAVDWLELRGPSDCSLWTDAQWAKLLERLGPDPLGSVGWAFDTLSADGPTSHMLSPDDPQPAFDKIAKARTPISVLLMQQDVIAGIGNIYRAELLFRERLSPFVEGRAVPLKRLKAMWKDAIPLMRAGMVDRRIVTTRSKDRPHKRGIPLKEEVHYVYRRHGKPCFACGAKILRRDLAGRTLYWCPVCQPAEMTGR